MKHPIIFGITSLFITLMSLSTPAIALDMAPEHRGLYGNIHIGGGFISSRPSGLDVLDDNERRDDLSSRDQRTTESQLLLSADLGYRFQEGSTLGVGIRTEGPFYLSLSHKFEGLGEMTLSALYEKKEVWQNPYLVGVNRSRTDFESFGFSADMKQILGTGMRIVFKQMNVDIADDLIGQAEPALRRDGTDTTLGIGYDWNLGAGGVLSSGLSHIWFDRDGAGNTGCAYVAELKHVVETGRLTFSSDLEFKEAQFDAIHPVFNKKRQESTFTISEMISFAEPLGYENWSIFVVAAYSATDSNSTFFDSSGLLSGAGISYKF